MHVPFTKGNIILKVWKVRYMIVDKSDKSDKSDKIEFLRQTQKYSILININFY